MAGNLNVLRNIQQDCEAKRTFQVSLDLEFLVIGIYCYLADRNFLKSFQTEPESDFGAIYLYDIIITDGVSKYKCVLGIPLGKLVQENILKVGSKIRVKQVKLAYEECERRVGSYVVLERLEVGEMENIPQLGTLHFFPNSSQRESGSYPLITNREFYLNPWLTQIPFGPEWNQSDNPDNYVNPDDNTIKIIERSATLLELSQEWKSTPKPYSPLLLIIIFKGRLHLYGSNRSDHKYPLQGYLDVADSTGTSSIVLWNKINSNLFCNLKPGQIILVEYYHVTEKYPRRDKPQFRGTSGRLPNFNMEIKLNDSSKLRILTPPVPSLACINPFPSVGYQFVTRSGLKRIPHDSNVDIVGLITYVGRYEREFCKGVTGVRTGGFYGYRWLQLLDYTSSLPFIVLLFIKNWEKELNNIHPGQVLVCTQLLVSNVLENESGPVEQPIPILISTSVTQVNLTHLQGHSYMKEKAVSDFAKWIQSDEIVNTIKSTSLHVGGYFPFPPCKKLVEQNILHNIEEGKLKVTPASEWRNELKSFYYREHRKIAAAGKIIRVDFVNRTVSPNLYNKGHIFSSEEGKRINIYLCTQFYDTLENAVYIGHPVVLPDSLPRHYTRDHKECLLQWLKFPEFCAEEWKPPLQERWKDIPSLCDGYYVLYIIGLSIDVILQCILIPYPAKEPYPSFSQLLNNDYILRCKESNTNSAEFPCYTHEELKKVKDTVNDVCPNKFLFFLDLYCHAEKKVEIMLHHTKPFTGDVMQIFNDQQALSRGESASSSHATNY